MPSHTFRFNGTWDVFVVPKEVYSLRWNIVGAGGGGAGGKGGVVRGTMRVKPGQVFYVTAGERGGDWELEKKSGIYSANKPTDLDSGRAAWGSGGAAGRGYGDKRGGWGGGGASIVRMTSRTGAIVGIAGGGGGASGDGGTGGDGGGNTGGRATKGSHIGGTPNKVTPATGGTQNKGGIRGYTTAGKWFSGQDARDTILGRAGAGGWQKGRPTYGGGGGGGGYRSGGGGASGPTGKSEGTGGGGGSSHVGLLENAENERGGGSNGDGYITVTYADPITAANNRPPSAPTAIKIDGKEATDEHITRSMGTVEITAELNDPNRFQPAAFEILYTSDSKWESGIQRAKSDTISTGEDPAKRATVVLKGLSTNTHYYARLWAMDSLGQRSEVWQRNGQRSDNYASIDWWTNRSPEAPELQSPPDNAIFPSNTPITFTWRPVDPDDSPDPGDQAGYRLYTRVSRTAITDEGPWVLQIDNRGPWNANVVLNRQWTIAASQFKSNTFYDWTVKTLDPGGLWGPVAPAVQFYVEGVTTPPIITHPTKDEAVDIAQPHTITWEFRDPDAGASQVRADLRYRPVGTSNWFNVPGDPGTAPRMTLDAGLFQPGVHYEFQVRTYDQTLGEPSDWSESATFWAIRTPGAVAAEYPLFDPNALQETLGCGMNRAFVYDRGGRILRGEITPLLTITWNRKRDDISTCSIVTNGFGEDCGQLLREIRAWAHEIVVFRDGVRVWEGPVDRVTDTPDGVEIEAKDVMNYVYRRVMRQGYNDSYRVINKDTPQEQQLGLRTIVDRAGIITANALAPDDPNVLPYMTKIMYPDDARQSRVVPDYSRTAWEEIDDLGATAGLDYTVVGRRIIYWDTHRSIGRLAELRDVHFDSPPIITQYGMQFATDFAVTNNNGIWGQAQHRPLGPEGLVEQLASAYGEVEGAAEEVLTTAAQAALQEALQQQANRNIVSRNPVPLVVRVPDNSMLMPDTPVHINHLVPGVWVPLRARGIIYNVAQWQKLDLVTVAQDKAGEKVTVTMGPAPNQGADPDAENSGEEV